VRRRQLASAAVVLGFVAFFVGFIASLIDTRARGSVPALLIVVTMVVFLCGLAGFAYLLFQYAFPYLVAGRSRQGAAERVAAIRASGTMLWAGENGGAVGSLFASAGMMAVAVYPGGIVGKIRFMAPFAVMVDEITAVSFGRLQRIEIKHRGVDVQSPLLLYGGRESAQAAALLAIAPSDVSGASESRGDTA
jgi:hypothetical protein